MRIAFIIRDPLPPTRADVLTLFGAELPRHGIVSCLIGQRGGGSMLAAAISPFQDAVGLWRAGQVDCVQVRDKVASGVVGRIGAALRGVPFVYWMSFPFVEGYAARRDQLRPGPAWMAHALRARLSRFVLYRLVLPGAHHLFVQSDAMADWLAGKGVARARMTAVPMGVDAALFDRAHIVPSSDPRLAGRRVIVYLGRVARARRSDFLLDVVERLRAGLPDILLVLAGDAASPDEMDWMRGQVAARGLDRHVLLTGWLPQRDALGYAVRAEVGLSPIPRGALFDVSSPTKLVEYLALGIAAVANDIPDQQLVLGQSGAGLSAPMEAVPFSAAVRALLDDPILRNACAARGPAWVARHRTYDILGRAVARTYARIVPGAADSAPVLMIGTDPDGKGGIASVVKVLAADGLFERESVRYLISHRDGVRAGKAVAALRAFGQTAAACLIERPAVVHVHSASRASFVRKSILLVLARAAGCRTIFHLHGAEFDRFASVESGAALRWWIRYTLERSSVVIALSDSWAVFLRGLAPAARVVVLPNSVPLPACERDEEEAGRILFLGRADAGKGVFELLSAVAALAPAFPHLHLVIGGVGTLQAIRARAEQLGIGDRVTVAGWLDAAAKTSELARAQIFCLPSHAEGLPMAMLEAMAAAKAVVASAVGGIPEAIGDGDNGLLVAPRDAPGLAAALALLLRDDALRLRLGQRARATVQQRFSPAAATGQLAALYRELRR